MSTIFGVSTKRPLEHQQMQSLCLQVNHGVKLTVKDQWLFLPLSL